MNAESEMAGADGLGGEPDGGEACCDDCGRTWPIGELAEPERLSERLDPGGVVPAGECPECGALAYPVEPSTDPLDELAREVGYSDGADDDEAGGVDALIDYKNALEDRCRRVEGELDRAEAALTQCQHVAYDGTVQIGERAEHKRPLESAAEYQRMLEAKVERICNIAEGGAADPEFVAMLAKAAEDDAA